MFTIEHEFDKTVITLMDDDVTTELEEDVSISLYEDKTVIEQIDHETGQVNRIALSPAQLKYLIASVNLPEGTYMEEK